MYEFMEAYKKVKGYTFPTKEAWETEAHDRAGEIIERLNRGAKELGLKPAEFMQIIHKQGGF